MLPTPFSPTTAANSRPAAPSLAASVCITCKARKKKCDKLMPCCSYCAERKLECHYPQHNHGLPHKPGGRRTTPMKMGIPASPRQSQPVADSSSLLLMDAMTQSALSEQIPKSTWLDLGATKDPSLCRQAHRLIEATGQYLDEISVRYFQGIHNFIPIISRTRFHTQLMSSGSSPQTDFSIQLLVICLLTYHPGLAQRSSGLISDSALYLATRSVVAQAQAICPPSLHLIQALVLLAVYEYAHGQPELAFASIGGCARMARCLAMTQPSSLPISIVAGGAQLDEEEVNTWWGIIICQWKALSPHSPSTPSASTFHSPNVGSFGRAAQATALLDHVIKTFSLADISSKQTTLDELDSLLRSFLAAVMQQCQGTWVVYCGAIAIAIRALFLLHWRILGELTENASLDHRLVEEMSNNSFATLDTVTKMVIDIADSHGHVTTSFLDTLPPSCAYITRAALTHIRDRRHSTPDSGLRKAEERLQHSLSQFNHRWGVHADPFP
ncbi:hypothetical protein N7462_010183 [Penicillium macrosclerotiorum]|uniref:uncharacterized protein n=1 Tax=Penicillium macrosclerotiorum TaxID=303699 RepID=UPI00254859B4|nr:uncharacterized protein N7462_010183 [Penicillium macrosclerotiorum]KAJ5669113.1 hypothetical protein N7462_010183 [Penicillium macrosclerotiorum]